jgi:protein CpxP
MKIYSRLAVLTAMGLSTMTAYGATGNDANSPALAEHTHMGHHMRSHMHHSPFMMALHQLNLTEAQRASIKSIMEASHAQMKSEFAEHSDNYMALLNPGDPNYAEAVRRAEAAATARIERRSQDETQMYNLLTAEQKAKLPEVLAAMKTRMEQRHSEWQQHHDKAAN